MGGTVPGMGEDQLTPTGMALAWVLAGDDPQTVQNFITPHPRRT